MTPPVEFPVSAIQPEVYQISGTTANRLPLARTPTPLQPLPRLSAEIGKKVWVKRDDMTDSVASGNKLRKLEFSIAQALSEGASVLITNGGVQSNHCRATATVAAQLGLAAHLVLRGDQPDVADGNLLLDKLLGATTTFIDLATWRRIDDFTQKLVADYAARDVTAYSIPTGASDDVGLWGYIRGFEELHRDIETAGAAPDAIIHATGSGGTQAGLILGSALVGSDISIAGVNVSDDAAYFTGKIREDMKNWRNRYQSGVRDPLDTDNLPINILDGHVGPGYGQADAHVYQTIQRLARLEGIILDPVYTGKAFDGMLTELASGRLRDVREVVFLHTGGIYGLFPHREEIARL